jgi:hypothetical protein
VDAIGWIKENLNEKGYVNLDLKKSKEGKIYLQKNDWKPEQKDNQEELNDINLDDIKF